MRPLHCEHCGAEITRSEPQSGLAHQSYAQHQDGHWLRISMIGFSCPRYHRTQVDHAWGRLRVMSKRVPFETVPDLYKEMPWP